MQSLKESARYANFLEKTLSRLAILSISSIDASLYKTTENHKKSTANNGYNDEVKEVEYENKVDLSVPQLTELVLAVLEEKKGLSQAISIGKGLIEINVDLLVLDLDPAIEYAKTLRRVSSDYLSILANVKDTKKKSMDRGYMINVEGNQVSFTYEVEKETKIIFDQSVLSVKNKELKTLADKLSEKIEEAMSSDKIDFTPNFNYLDTIDELIKGFEFKTVV